MSASVDITVYTPEGGAVIWNGQGGSWGSWNNFDRLQINGKNTPAYTFSFGQIAQSSSFFDQYGGFHYKNNGVLASNSQFYSSFVFETKTKALLIGESDSNYGSLNINFIDDSIANNIPSNWNADTSKQRKVDLKLNTTTSYNSKTISLIGNIRIRAGVGENKNTFTSSFAGDMIGSIYIFPHYTAQGHFYKDVNTTFNFNNSASLRGSIYTDLSHNSNYGGAGNNTFNFQTGGIEGGIISGTFNPESMQFTNTINFNTGGTSPAVGTVTSFIDGNIEVHPGAQNTINFNRDNDARIGKLISNSGSRPTYFNIGRNIVNFSGSTLTISNGIITNGNDNLNGIGNQITLKKENTQLVVSSGGLVAIQTDNLNQLGYVQTNKIVFEKGGTLTLNGNNTTSEGSSVNFDGILARDFEVNDIAFQGNQNATITVASEIRSQNTGINKITFNGTGTNTIDANIKINGKGENNIILTNNGTNLNLKGKTTGGTTHQISSLTATKSGANTLTLDNSAVTSGAMETTIHSITNGGNLSVILKGNGAGKGATLTLDNASGTTLKSVAVGSGATANTIAFNAGSNEIIDAINGTSIGSGQDLSINLSGANTSLNLVGGLSKGSGSAYINIANGANATLSGAGIDATKLSFAGASTLTINNSSASLGEISIASGANATLKGETVSATTLSFTGTSALNLANEGATITGISVASGNATLSGIALSGSNLTFADNTTLTLNNAGDSFGLVNTTSASTNGATLTIGSNLDASIAQLQGNNLKVNFAKREQNGNAKLSILDSQATDKTITLKGVSVANDSTNNTLDLSSLTTVNIGSAVSLAKDTELTFNLKDTALTFTVGLTSAGTTKITVADTTSGATIAGTTVDASELEMSGANAKVTFTATQITLGTLDAKASGSNELVIGEASAKTSLTIGSANSTLDSVSLEGTSATLAINGGTQTIEALTTEADTNNLSFANNTLTLGAITNTGNKAIKLNLNNSTLALKEDTYALSSLTANNSLIDMAMTDNNGRPRARGAKTLTIGANSGDGFKGNASFEVYVDQATNTADKVVFSKAQQNNGGKSVATIIASGDANTILNGNGTITVATVDSGSTANIKVVGGERLIGGVVIKTVLTDKNKDGTEWTLGKGVDEGAPIQYQAIASTALTVNYDLFLANFNSLNKRMGELRDNPHSQGVWTRVFGGAMSNDFGAGSKTEYVTAQAGYDYSLTLGDANNYMGIAVAYGKSWTKSNSLSMNGLLGSSGSIALQDVNSNMVEVGIYNSYVMDSGWYNDTIFKFDYIMSEFSLSNDVNTITDTSNFAMVLSDEFGYRYKFAESEKGNWYIDPQVEVAFGYFNQSDFNRAMYDTTTGIYQSTMEATQDTILTLRTRAGMSLGKKFNTAKGFASLYVGAFYEYDYINGGNTSVAGRAGGTVTSFDSIESNGRAIVNIGSNIELTEGVRMYIDVEKSFGDKQRVDMQFNFGARYSFGEKTPTISYQEQQKKRVAPLKVENKQETNTQATSEQEAKK